MNNLIKALQQRLSKQLLDRHPAKLSWLREKWLKIQDDSTLKSITIHRLTFYYKARFTMYHTYPDIFVREIYKFSTSSTHPIIIDCGANIGLSILYFAQHYPQAQIIAFEPDKKNFEILSKNIQANLPQHQNVVLRQNAVWVSNSEISFYASGTEASSIVADTHNAHKINVSAIRLKEVLASYPSIDFLKVDIEGAEYEVIKDCIPELKHVQNFFLEYHGTIEETYKLRELLDIVADAGFYIYISPASELLQRPFFQKKSGEAFDVQQNIFCYR